MNDFTKDELKVLLTFADVYTEFGSSFTWRIHKDLIYKIQDMVENYDNDENKRIIYIVTACDGCDMHIEKCFLKKEDAEKYKDKLSLGIKEYFFSIRENVLEE